MVQYIYGASIQGIQSFIFETGKLKEIVGASEIVEKVCTDFVQELLKCLKIEITEKNMLRQAAGNVRFICDENQAKQIVRCIPKITQEMFPGITISQALVKFEEPLAESHINELEERLNIQRNRPNRPANIGLSAVARAPRTGRPAYKREDDELIDITTNAKIKYGTDTEEATKRLAYKLLGGRAFHEIGGTKVRFPFEFSDIVKPDICEWLAIIHADGNSLGKMLQSLGDSFQKHPDKVADGYRMFSRCLDKATIESAKIAFEKVIVSCTKKEDKSFPFRPVILGGDDLTVICRADLAIDFTKEFLANFEQISKKEFSDLVKQYGLNCQNGLTACAGIAFIKESYPFHYGYHLAEELCQDAKKASKNVNSDHVPSSIAFHKILSSFHDKYKTTVERELTAQAPDAKEPVSFHFGPYAIADNAGLTNITSLTECVDHLKKKDSPKSGLRRWLSELHNSRFAADEIIKRLVQIAGEKKEFKLNEFDQDMSKLKSGLSLQNPIVKIENDKTETSKIPIYKTPIYDMLSLLSLEGGD